jgi:prepilin-type N-terminal cleavage/methylation domain-containing protein/prepilin-type processing-associated H-X9-DG protein
MVLSTTTERHGFTLVELLVVITIIGILIGLLLPAVQSARESGRGAQCQNNIRQVGLAMKHHESEHTTFPVGGWGWGWVGDADRGYGLEQPGGWVYNILSYMEQQPLHDLGMGAGAITSPLRMQLNGQRNQTPLGGFLCPSRRAVALFPFTSYAEPNYKGSPMVAKTDYAANGGDTPAWPSVFNLWPGNCYNGDCGPAAGSIPASSDLTKLSNQVMSQLTETINNVKIYGPTGIIAAMTMVSTADIRDGLANTYLVGEKYLIPDRYLNGGDMSDNETMYIGDNPDITRYSYLPPMRDRRGYDEGGVSFGSPHVNGFNACMCDGSVRTITYTIDPTVHRYLGNRADNVAVSPPE